MVLLDNNIIGHIKKMKDSYYVVVNKSGTLEKLPEIKLFPMLYLEIRQGLNKPLELNQLRKYCIKYKKKIKENKREKK